MIVALGMARVIGTEGVDLSVGSVMALSAAASCRSISAYGRWPATLVVAARRARGRARSTDAVARLVGLQPIVATLGAAGGWPRHRPRHRGRPAQDVRNAGDLFALGYDDVAGLPSPSRRRRPGRATGLLVRPDDIRAAASSRSATTGRPAGLAGLPVRRVLVVMYVLISGVLAAFAGPDPRPPGCARATRANTGLLSSCRRSPRSSSAAPPCPAGRCASSAPSRGAAHAAPPGHPDQARSARLDGPDGAGGRSSSSPCTSRANEDR